MTDYPFTRGRGPREVWDVTGFGVELKMLRLQAGISLSGLARRVPYSKGYLSKVETGRARPNMTLAHICDSELGTGGRLASLVQPRRETETAPVSRIGTALLSSKDIPKLLKILHRRMARVRERLDVMEDWELVPFDSIVTPTMLANACDPANTRLLDWTVYETVLQAAASPAEVDDIRKLFHTIEAVKAADPTSTRSEQEPQPGRMNRLQWQLAEITTEAGLMDHLKTLRTQKGWSLRKTEQQIRLRHPKTAVSNSTLSTWFRQPRLPADRVGFEALVHTLLPDHLNTAGPAPLAIYMHRYDELRATAEHDQDSDDTTEETTQPDWQAMYETSERERRRLSTLLIEARKIITDQESEIAQLRDWTTPPRMLA